MVNFTIVTCTYNRANVLKRAYLSLKNQTCKDFLWMIVDDGSTDNTNDIVKAIKEESPFDILYIQKENGGKHTALKIGFEGATTKYIIDLDDDDELTPDCVETFKREWEKIESRGREDIGSIRALTIDENGKILGKYNPQEDIATTDSDFIEMNYYKRKNYENQSSYKTDAIKKANLFRDENRWLYDQIKFISEGIFWSRLARKYKTRYIFQPLRIYHYDGAGSLSRPSSNSRQKWVNKFFSSSIMLDEFMDVLLKCPYQFFRNFAIFNLYSAAARLPFKKVLKTLHSRLLQFLVIICRPVFFFGGIWLRKS